MKNYSLSLFILLLIQSTLSFAWVESPLYFWDNQQNFVKGSNCEIKATKSNPFKVSRYYGSASKKTENLRNYNGVRQSHLINHSLVKFIKGAKKTNYKKVQVVGLNERHQISVNKWFSRRGDQGYLFHRSLLPMEDFLFTLGEKSPRAEIEELNFSAKGSIWQLVSNENIYSLHCENMSENRNYFIFRVLQDNLKSDVVAYIGVSVEETGIFSSILSQEIEESSLNFLPFNQLSAQTGLMLNEQSSVENEESLEAESQIIEVQESTPSSPMVTQLEEHYFTDQIICTTNINTRVNIRNKALNKILFKAKLGERVNIFQTWDAQPRIRTIRGEAYEFVKVQFKEREESDQIVGWIAKSFVKYAGNCKAYRGNMYIRNHKTEITSLDDDQCCEFPLEQKPTHSYTSGMRKFKSHRSNRTRFHAACDLYRYKDEPVLALAPGEVISDLYYFYQGTYALEVEYPGGYVVRYGEITGKRPKNIKRGSKVKMGDQIGYIGKVNSNCCRPMLHFELFDGSQSGPLTRAGNQFKRRSDLIDPTNYLLKWEEQKF